MDEIIQILIFAGAMIFSVIVQSAKKKKQEKPSPQEVLEEAEELGIVVLATAYTNYTTCGMMYEAGIRGTNERAGA